MSLLTSFYFLSLFFIFFTIYELVNRDIFYFEKPDLTKPLKYIGFYFTKVCYWIWIIVGAIYTDLSIWFYWLIGFFIFKFVVVLSKKDYIINLYDLIFGYIFNILFMIIIFRLGVFR
jgi:hypothetical protein